MSYMQLNLEIDMWNNTKEPSTMGRDVNWEEVPVKSSQNILNGIL